ncbi:hypothetical protein DUNSADRAFT_16455 [Dunaliella salina]|uniref:Encoded protein n=1 Tax=Dunaliella salina TaxID=3046 RepID=A0ABQ7H0Z1_DUNSA|nr:hypothetical protein DUNSADRAFT_16455 [Dunaliella salina]|eukprot:KAF5840514.1 hypothetical protein DUNSADRAFT_16455 [Dunaliella salina]
MWRSRELKLSSQVRRNKRARKLAKGQQQKGRQQEGEAVTRMNPGRNQEHKLMQPSMLMLLLCLEQW